MELAVEVARVIGNCNAGLSTGDRFRLSVSTPSLGEDCRLCREALLSILLNVGRVSLGAKIASCSSCKWELCQSIPECLRLIRHVAEPSEARHFVAEAIAHQDRGEHTEADREMKAVLQLLRCRGQAGIRHRRYCA